MKIEELKSKLEKLASEKTLYDRCEEDGEDFNPCDASGGNFDDAYQMGVDDGRIDMARDVLGWLEKE